MKVGDTHLLKWGEQVVEVTLTEDKSFENRSNVNTDLHYASTSGKQQRNNKSAITTEQNFLGPGVKYKLVVYNNQGAYVTEKDYAYGSESTTPGIALNAGETYTFVAYSINSTQNLPAITTPAQLDDAYLDNISSDLMYFSKTLQLNYGENRLSVVMKHLFSQITTALYMDNSVTGTITNIGATVLNPTHTSADVKLKQSATQITYNGLNNSGKTVLFESLGSGLRTVTSTPVILVHPGSTTGSMTINSITIDGDTKNNLSIPNIKVTPGYKYKLNLTFKTCTQNVTSEDMNWNYPVTTQNSVKGILVGGVFYPNNAYMTKTFAVTPADYGFQFDITEFDNAFNMKVNNQFIFGISMNDQIQFQTNSGLGTVRNIQFIDGDEYTLNNIPEVFDMVGTSAKPLLRILISKTGEVTLLGSKSSGGNLVQLKMKNNLQLNTINWNTTSNNQVVISQKVDGKTVIIGKGTGRKKINCTN